MPWARKEVVRCKARKVVEALEISADKALLLPPFPRPLLPLPFCLSPPQRIYLFSVLISLVGGDFQNPPPSLFCVTTVLSMPQLGVFLVLCGSRSFGPLEGPENPWRPHQASGGPFQSIWKLSGSLPLSPPSFPPRSRLLPGP